VGRLAERTRARAEGLAKDLLASTSGEGREWREAVNLGALTEGLGGERLDDWIAARAASRSAAREAVAELRQALVEAEQEADVRSRASQGALPVATLNRLKEAALASLGRATARKALLDACPELLWRAELGKPLPPGVPPSLVPRWERAVRSAESAAAIGAAQQAVAIARQSASQAADTDVLRAQAVARRTEAEEQRALARAARADLEGMRRAVEARRRELSEGGPAAMRHEPMTRAQERAARQSLVEVAKQRGIEAARQAFSGRLEAARREAEEAAAQEDARVAAARAGLVTASGAAMRRLVAVAAAGHAAEREAASASLAEARERLRAAENLVAVKSGVRRLWARTVKVDRGAEQKRVLRRRLGLAVAPVARAGQRSARFRGHFLVGCLSLSSYSPAMLASLRTFAKERGWQPPAGGGGGGGAAPARKQAAPPPAAPRAGPGASVAGRVRKLPGSAALPAPGSFSSQGDRRSRKSAPAAAASARPGGAAGPGPPASARAAQSVTARPWELPPDVILDLVTASLDGTEDPKDAAAAATDLLASRCGLGDSAALEAPPREEEGMAAAAEDGSRAGRDAGSTAPAVAAKDGRSPAPSPVPGAPLVPPAARAMDAVPASPEASGTPRRAAGLSGARQLLEQARLRRQHARSVISAGTPRAADGDADDKAGRAARGAEEADTGVQGRAAPAPEWGGAGTAGANATPGAEAGAVSEAGTDSAADAGSDAGQEPEALVAVVADPLPPPRDDGPITPQRPHSLGWGDAPDDAAATAASGGFPASRDAEAAAPAGRTAGRGGPGGAQPDAGHTPVPRPAQPRPASARVRPDDGPAGGGPSPAPSLHPPPGQSPRPAEDLLALMQEEFGRYLEPLGASMREIMDEPTPKRPTPRGARPAPPKPVGFEDEEDDYVAAAPPSPLSELSVSDASERGPGRVRFGPVTKRVVLAHSPLPGDDGWWVGVDIGMEPSGFTPPDVLAQERQAEEEWRRREAAAAREEAERPGPERCVEQTWPSLEAFERDMAAYEHEDDRERLEAEQGERLPASASLWAAAFEEQHHLQSEAGATPRRSARAPPADAGHGEPERDAAAARTTGAWAEAFGARPAGGHLQAELGPAWAEAVRKGEPKVAESAAPLSVSPDEARGGGSPAPVAVASVPFAQGGDRPAAAKPASLPAQRLVEKAGGTPHAPSGGFRFDADEDDNDDDGGEESPVHAMRRLGVAEAKQAEPSRPAASSPVSGIGSAWKHRFRKYHGVGAGQSH